MIRFALIPLVISGLFLPTLKVDAACPRSSNRQVETDASNGLSDRKETDEIADDRAKSGSSVPEDILTDLV